MRTWVTGRDRGRLRGELCVALLLACGWLGGLASPARALSITAPPQGLLTEAPTVVIAGEIPTPDAATTLATLDGAPLALDESPDPPLRALFSVEAALDPVVVFNSFLVEAVLPDASTRRARVTVVSGPSIPDGEASPRSAALRVTASGLEAMGPAIEDLVELDLSTVLPVGRRIFNECLVDSFAGCLGRARVFIDDPPPDFSSQAVELGFDPEGVALAIALTDVRIDLDIDGSGVVPNCRLRLTASSVQIRAVHAVAPDALDPSELDLQQVGAVGIDFDRFRQNFTGGSCEDGLIEDIVDDIVGDLEGDVRRALRDVLEDPDGAGPDDGPLADAIEDALAEVEIAAPIGRALRVDLEAPIDEVTVDASGLTAVNDLLVDALLGGEDGCDAPIGAPDPSGSYEPDVLVPLPQGLTPGSGSPYDLALALSDAAFDQGLEAFTVCGLLHSNLDELTLGDAVFPIDAGLLALIEPAFSALDPDLPLTIEVRPTVAPILSDGAGPDGELAPLQIGDLRIRIVDPVAEQLWLELAVDATTGLDLAPGTVPGELELGTAGELSDVSIAVLGNAIEANEGDLVATLQSLLESGTLDLSDALGSFRLPELLGLALVPIEIAREPGGAVFYFEAVPEPPTAWLAFSAVAVLAALRARSKTTGARCT